MKLHVSLAILNGNGVSAGVESSSDDFDSLRLNESYSMSPQKACRNAAKKLRDAAARFDLLAEFNRDKIFKRSVHATINNSKKVGKCTWFFDKAQRFNR